MEKAGGWEERVSHRWTSPAKSWSSHLQTRTEMGQAGLANVHSRGNLGELLLLHISCCWCPPKCKPAPKTSSWKMASSVHKLFGETFTYVQSQSFNWDNWEVQLHTDRYLPRLCLTVCPITFSCYTFAIAILGPLFFVEITGSFSPCIWEQKNVFSLMGNTFLPSCSQELPNFTWLPMQFETYPWIL